MMWLPLVLGWIGFLAAGADADVAAITGTWRGQSVCVTNAPACRTEQVVYYIKEVPKRTDVVLIQADRIVDRKAITMGSGEWQYHGAQHALEWSTPRQVWLLRIAGIHIDGTLTLADRSIFRKMSLDKDK
jgi:hypothetical protein